MPNTDECIRRIRERAAEAERRAQLAEGCYAYDTAKLALASAARLRIEAEELEKERFIPVYAGE